jgi:hypothetical protein
MLRVLVSLAAFVALVAVIVHELYTMASPKLGWSVPLAILVAGGGVVVVGIVLRNAVARTPRRRRAMPSDPGFPRKPLGAPYRGPH